MLFTSCKETTNQSSENQLETKVMVGQAVVKTSQPKSNGTFLCKINGKDWAYTKASGIVSRHKKTKKRTAIITFTKQLEKGRESIQLFYDGDTNILEKVTADIKQPKKGGGRMSAMYQLLNQGGTRHPESKVSGTIDLSNPTAAGTAEVLKMKIRFNEGNLKDDTMRTISFTPINFTGIGYSDSDKLFGSKDTQKN